MTARFGASQPDIVLLVLDTQRADRLSAYGYGASTSPALDAFAAESTLFRHAMSAAQWTVPSHSSLFTGLYPSFHDTRQSFSVLPAELPTLAQRLGEGGYSTAAFCNNPLVGVVNNGLRRGFDSFLNYAGLFTSRPNQAGRRRTLFGWYRQWFKRNLADAVHRFQDYFARSDAWLEFALTTPFMLMIWQTALNFKGNTPKSLNDAARLLIDRKGVKPGRPIFTFINVMGTHMPFHPSRKHVTAFAPGFFEDREAQRYLQRFNSDVLGWLTPTGAKLAAHHREIISGMYNAEVATQDDHLRMFFDRLAAAGKLDNTLFVITADHGEHLGEKHFIGHNVTLYNELTHVPLIIRDPAGAFPQGAEWDHLVSTRRIFHTILAAAGLADEQEQRYSLMHGPARDPDEGVVFAEAQTPQNVLNIITRHAPELVQEYRCDQERRAVWHNRHKLILTGDDGVELFDFRGDPAEQRNLAAEQPEVVKALSERLRGLAARAAAGGLTAGRVVQDEDPTLNQRLRTLGYLE